MSLQDVVTQHLLDAEITSLRNTLIRLVARRNTLSPISRLPVEIISTIIWMHQQTEVEEDDTCFYWIKVSHVSRQWREIAINMPQLWTRIHFQYPPWVKEMLKRSQNLGLIICVNPSRGSHPTVDAKLRTIRTCIKHHITRVREIDIRGFPKDIHLVLEILFQPIRGPFTKNAPKLHVLRLPGLSQRHIDPVSTLERFFVHANNLKVVDISCAKNWDSRLFTNLTHLKVENPKGLARPTQVQFFSALRRMPLLVSLDLRGDVLPLLPLRPNTPGCGPVALSELQSLTLADEASVIPHFMTAVSFPSALVVDIRCSIPATQFTNVSTTIAHLPPTYSSSNSIVRGLRLDVSKLIIIRHRPNIQVDLETWYTVPSAATVETNRGVNPFRGDPFLTLGLSWLATVDPPTEAQECRQAISHFCVAVPCKNLSVLSLTSSDLNRELPIIDDAIFTELLGVQPELHSVFVTGSIVKVLFKNLEPREMHRAAVPQNDNVDQAVSKSKTLFPEMRYLSISDFDFSGETSDFFDCLFARYTYGYKLETLSISNCTGLKNGVLIEILGQVVSNLVWDQRRLPYPTSSSNSP